MNTSYKISAAALALSLVFAPSINVVAARALAVRTAVQDDGPSDAETGLFNRGQNHFIAGQYEQAISAFKDFLKTYPNSVITDLTLLWLGRSYMQTGQLQEAEQVSQRLKAIRDTPFVDIYASELETARAEAARRGPASSPPSAGEVAAAASPRVQPAQPPVAASPTPAPTRPPAAREIATAQTSVSGTDNGRAPSLVRRGEGANQRVRRATRPRGGAQPPSPAASAPEVEIATNTATTRPTPAPSVPEVEIATANVAQPRSTPRPAAPSQVASTNTLTSAPPAASEPAVQGGGFSITVKQVPNLQLALRRAAFSASPGQTVQLPITITNTGNKEDQFSVETDLPAEFQPAFSAAPGGTDTGLPVLVTPQLGRGANFDATLNLRIPDNAPDNKQLSFFVRAASQADHQVFKVADAALTVAAAALTANTNLSQESVMPGETFTQHIAMKNMGSAAARGSRVDFVFSPDFELVSADPSPLVYDRASRTAIWSLGEVDSRQGRDITVTLRAVTQALAATRAVGRGTMKTQSLTTPANFDGPSITVGRVPRARIDAVSTGLTATPGDIIYIPFVVRNPSNYPEAYELRVTAPGAPAATVFADTNGDGLHQDGEPSVTQTGQIEPRGGQYPVLLRVDIPRSTPDRQQFAYNVVTRALGANRVASEASTVLTVATPRVRVRPELPTAEVNPGDTIFYRLVLVNDGAGLAKNLVLTEQLPDALEFVSSEPSLGPAEGAGGAQRFVWRVGELSPSDTAVLKIAVRIKPNIAAGATLSPAHTLTYQDGNGNSYRGQ